MFMSPDTNWTTDIILFDRYKIIFRRKQQNSITSIIRKKYLPVKNIFRKT